MKSCAQRTLQALDFEAWRTRRAAADENAPLLGRHYDCGDRRLARLRFDDSDAADSLWELLLSEEDRLAEFRRAGGRIVGTMKDLGTVPVMAYSLPGIAAFYPDGAWWTPCLMEQTDGLFALADTLGVDATFCPVRALLGAFVNRERFPIPDMLTCSVGAVCDDLSAIAQRLEGLGYPILWWEMPYRRDPEPDEPSVTLPGGVRAPVAQVQAVSAELTRVREALADLAAEPLTDARLIAGIRAANVIRRQLYVLRETIFTASRAPLPALELLVAEMLAIHFCSDRGATKRVLDGLIRLAARRATDGEGYGRASDARVFWVNPVADLRAMLLLEKCGARLCGTDFIFTHALDQIPETDVPIEGLARSALADPMVGPARQRAARVVAEMRRLGAEALVVARIPGASHCAYEGAVIVEAVERQLRLPCVEFEVPSLADAAAPALRTRLEALVETVRGLREDRHL
ncbi:MAG: 2-hydroxyacyl-CoA dehydratase family protein [Kiritimatiellae bacterium]|nr:2-hydroxyacyl-CoA dehydratase family protein [Kiritimatiellia bacterium]